MDPFDLLDAPAEVVAVRLLGSILERMIDNEVIRVRIVETEAYDQSDPASHSFRGQSARNQVMFGPPGRAYVYFTYGMHYCLNIVCGGQGDASAVLIRGVEPLEGLEVLKQHRNNAKGPAITNGPAKLTQALAIGLEFNGHDLRTAPLRLVFEPEIPADQIVVSPRIGLSKALDTMWRFYIRNNAYVSR